MADFMQSGNKKELKTPNFQPHPAQNKRFVQWFERIILHKTITLCRSLLQMVTFQEPVFLHFFFTFLRIKILAADAHALTASLTFFCGRRLSSQTTHRAVRINFNITLCLKLRIPNKGCLVSAADPETLNLGLQHRSHEFFQPSMNIIFTRIITNLSLMAAHSKLYHNYM